MEDVVKANIKLKFYKNECIKKEIPTEHFNNVPLNKVNEYLRSFKQKFKAPLNLADWETDEKIYYQRDTFDDTSLEELLIYYEDNVDEVYLIGVAVIDYVIRYKEENQCN